MNAFNSITSTLFDGLLGWFGHASAWFDIFFWAILGGIVALMVYKVVSNQKGIEKAKNGIKVHLMEIRLFQDDLLGVVVSTGKILAKNALYIGHNILPMVVMFIPMMAILFQLEAHYALDPVAPGTEQMLSVKLDEEQTDVDARDVSLEVPPGVTIVNGPARIVPSGEVAWTVRADEPGDFTLTVHVGDETVTKGLAAGGDSRTSLPTPPKPKKKTPSSSAARRASTWRVSRSGRAAQRQAKPSPHCACANAPAPAYSLSCAARRSFPTPTQTWHYRQVTNSSPWAR